MKELKRVVINPSQNLTGFDRDLEDEKVKIALIDEVWKMVHSIRELADRLGFCQMSELSVEAKKVVNSLRKKEITLSSQVLKTLFNYADLLNDLITEVFSVGKEQTDIRLTLRSIQRLVSEVEEQDHSPVSSVVSKRTTKSATSFAYALENRTVEDELTETSIDADSRMLDNLANLLGELIMIRNNLGHIS